METTQRFQELLDEIEKTPMAILLCTEDEVQRIVQLARTACTPKYEEAHSS